MSASLSIHFGRGEPPSNDLRDYVGESDKWMIGSFFVDGPAGIYPANESYDGSDPTGWRGHLIANNLAAEAVRRVWESINEALRRAWERYLNPGMPEPSDTQPRLGINFVIQGGGNGKIGRDAAQLTAALNVQFGERGSLGTVSRSLFATGASASMTWIRSLLPAMQPGTAYKVLVGTSQSREPFGTYRFYSSYSHGEGDVFLDISGGLHHGELKLLHAEYRDAPPALAANRLEESDNLSVKPWLINGSGELVLWVSYPDLTYKKSIWQAGGFDSQPTELKIGSMPSFPGEYRVYLDHRPPRQFPYRLFDGGRDVVEGGIAQEVQAYDDSKPMSGVPIGEFTICNFDDLGLALGSKLPKIIPGELGESYSYTLSWEGGEVRVDSPFPIPFTVTRVQVLLIVEFSDGRQLEAAYWEETVGQLVRPGASLSIPLEGEGGWIPGSIYGYPAPTRVRAAWLRLWGTSENSQIENLFTWRDYP